MEYTGKYINVTRDELMQAVSEQITAKRFAHVLRVEATARELATANGESVEKASIAALMHDYAKDFPLDEMRTLAKQYWNPDEMDHAGGNVWHGFAAATIARQVFDVRDEDILLAIAAHTIGWHEMSQLVKIIFIADYIEPGRSFAGVDEARLLAQQSLELATGYKMKETIKHLINQEKKIFMPTIEFYNRWLTRRTI